MQFFADEVCWPSSLLFPAPPDSYSDSPDTIPSLYPTPDFCISLDCSSDMPFITQGLCTYDAVPCNWNPLLCPSPLGGHWVTPPFDC